MKWVIFVNNMVYPLLLLLGKNGKRNMIRSIKNIKDIEQVLLNLINFMIKRNMPLKNMINRNLEKEDASIVENLVTLVKTVHKNLVI